jgi:eukaryotic-like serine/threonine-protein kinase
VLPTPNSFHPASLVGTTLDGRYRILEHLATGGMGAVFRAEHVYMRKLVAVKLLRPELSGMADLAERFRREAEIAASLEHDHIVRVSDFGRSPEGWLFLVMELLEGESLYERLSGDAPLEPPEVLRILVQVCRGLEAAHRRGVIHRDLKPENIFLVRPSGAVKVLDFGIAKLNDPRTPSDTHAGLVVGTPEYLSPEQASGSPVDARADVYAVGLMGWRMLAGHHPFQADDARGLLMMQATQPLPPLALERPELASWPELTAALERACSKDPAARQGSAWELGAELARCLPGGAGDLTALITPHRGTWAEGGQPTRVSGVGAPIPSRRARRRRGVILGAAALLAVLLLGGTAFLARWADERPVARARELLAANQPQAARDVLAAALLRRPSDPRLLVLHGRALHRIEGQASAAVASYAAALDLDPGALDDAALADLSADLRDQALAEPSARLLVRVGPAAATAVLAAARTGPGTSRLRALELTRQLGVEDRLDPVSEYGSLLSDPECAVRRVAVRRLADIGTPEALARLGELARQTREVRGLFGFPQKIQVCGAPEASAALRKVTTDRR